MNTTDTIYSYLLKKGQIRAYFLVAPHLLSEVNTTITDPVKKPFLLDALNITALISSLTKGQRRLSLRLRQKDLPDKLSTDGFSTGQVTGYMTNQTSHVDFENGTLQLIQTDTTGSSYTSFVGLETGRLYDDFATYFARSEQTPTVFLQLSTSANITCLLQSLPGNPIASLFETRQEVLILQETIAEVLQTPAKEIVPLLEAYLPTAQYLARQEIHYTCGCSAELFSSMLLSLSQEELTTIIANEETLTSQCSLCGKVYRFPPDYLTFYLA